MRIDEYQKLTKTLGNLKKNCRFYQKKAKIRDTKILKTIPLLLETMKCPINKPQRRLPVVLEAGKTEKMAKIFKNLKKMRILSKKIAKICDIRKLKPIPWQLKIFQ